MKFYQVAIVFLVFDIETAFLYPWALRYRQLSCSGPLESGLCSAGLSFFGLGVAYRWKPKMDIQFRYDLTYISVSFAGQAPVTSQRGHMGTGPSSGSDLHNALSAGVNYAF